MNLATKRVKYRTFGAMMAITTALLCGTSSSAAVFSYAGGDVDVSRLAGVGQFTLDVGLKVNDFSADRVIFESGGDGIGTGLVLIGSELVVYQDHGDFQVSTPTEDTFFTLDVASFANQTVSLRLVGDASNDTMTLDAFNGTTTLSTGPVSLSININGFAGNNGLGFGRTNGDIAGVDESAESGYPNMAPFTGAVYLGGELTLPGSALVGTLYTGSDAAPTTMPAPSSWAFVVPEPTAALGLLIGAAIARRR